MSSLQPGDAWMHYHDGSHRWPGTDEAGHAGRRRQVEEHQADHRRRLGDAPARHSTRDAVRVVHGLSGWAPLRRAS